MSNRRRYPLLFFLCLTSCNFTPSTEEQVKHLLTPPVVGEGAGGPFVRGDWPEAAWWTGYGSAELNGLVEQALQFNPTIQQVEARLRTAKERALQARAKLYPLITFDASDEWDYLSRNGLYRALNPTIPLNETLLDFSLSFQYEFDFWSKYRNLYRAALGVARAEEAEVAEAKLVASVSLAQGYFAYKTNLMRLKLYRELLAVRQKFFALQEEMLASSLYSKLPPLVSEEAVWEAEEWCLEVEREVAENRHLINVLAGRGPEEELSRGEELPRLPQALALPEGLSMGLLSRRPDLMAAIWRAEALAHEVGAAKAVFWPDIAIQAFAGLESGSWSRLFEWASKTIGMIPALSLPLYTAGDIAAGVGVKRGLFDEAIYRYNELLLESFRQVADLLSIGKAVYGEAERQGEIVANATQFLELTKLRQERGLDPLFATYQAIETLLMKKLQEVKFLYEQYRVSVQLIRALGGGYVSTPPLKKGAP